MRSRLTALAPALCAALGLIAPGDASRAEGPDTIRIRPAPIGAAAKLTSSRSEGGDAELPVEGLIPLSPPELRTRATLSTTTQTTTVQSIGDFSTISQTQVQDARITAPTAPTSSVTTTSTSSSGALRTEPKLTTTTIATSPVLTSKVDVGSVSTTRPTTTVTSPTIITSPIDRAKVLQPPRPSGEISDGPSSDGTKPDGSADPPAGEVGEDPSAAASDAEKSRRERLPPEEVAAIVLERLQLLAQIRDERRAREALEQQERDRVDGPSALGTVNLLEGLHVDAKVSLDAADILRVEHEIYQDANAKSGRFYYLPARYDLAWDPDHQYALTMIYGNAESEGAEGQVLMAARLQSGVDTRELDVVRELMRAYVRRHAGERELRFETLLPFALAGTTDVSLFGGASNEFSIPKDQISVQGASELLGVIDVSWAADQRRLLNVESLLRTKAGIHGQIGLVGAGPAKLARALPLSVDVASPRTFGRIAFERESGFRNAARYPLRFRTLHALVLARKSKGRVREGDPVVYSWDLRDTRVPPGAAVAWDADEVPEWLDSRALLQWVDYTVEGRCDACDELVFDERFIPSAAATRPIVMTATDVLATTGAARLAVRIRSKHLTPSRELAALPQAMITEDGAPKTLARLFVSDAELAADEPLYEYQLELTFADGRSFAGAAWTPTRNLDLLLGSESVRQAVGLPTTPPPAP